MLVSLLTLGISLADDPLQSCFSVYIHRWQITELEEQVSNLKDEEERLTKLKDQQVAQNWQVNVKLAKFERVKMERDQLKDQMGELTNNSEVQTLRHAVR